MRLQWDSNFWGIEYHHVTDPTEPTLGADFIQFIADASTAHKAEENGFKLADVRITFEKTAEKYDLDDDLIVDYPEKMHCPHSRFYCDDNFPKNKVTEFYKTWLSKCECYMIPGAYCAIDNNSIVLIGAENGQGYRMLKNIEGLMSGKIEVVTQGRNIAAQRLYQKCGFKTNKVELWYHKWKKIKKYS